MITQSFINEHVQLNRGCCVGFSFFFFLKKNSVVMVSKRIHRKVTLEFIL